MDPTLSGFEQLIPPIAQWLGVEPATVLLILGIIVTGSNLVGRLIPDDATGGLAIVRKVCKIVGLYIGNRVAPGVSTNEVAKAIVKKAVIDEAANAVKPAFPGLAENLQIGPGE